MVEKGPPPPCVILTTYPQNNTKVAEYFQMFNSRQVWQVSVWTRVSWGILRIGPIYILLDKARLAKEANLQSAHCRSPIADCLLNGKLESIDGDVAYKLSKKS